MVRGKKVEDVQIEPDKGAEVEPDNVEPEAPDQEGGQIIEPGEATESEAEILGISESKVSIANPKMTNQEAELARQEKLAGIRVANRIAKAKADAIRSAEESRVRLIKARLSNPNNQYHREQILHMRAELKAIKSGLWFAPIRQPDGTLKVWRLPEKRTAIEAFLNS